MNWYLFVLCIILLVCVIYLRLCKIEEVNWNDGICPKSKLIWNLKYVDDLGARHYADSLGHEITIFLTKIDLK